MKVFMKQIIRFFKERTFNIWQTYLFLILFSFAMLTLEFIYAVENNFDFGKNFFEFSIVFVLNVLPILGTTLFLYFLTRSVRVATIANFIFYNIIFIVNRIKILYRNEPLFISDLRLGAESVTITRGQSYSPGSLMLFLSFSAFVILLIAVFYFKSSKPKRRTSLIGMAVILCLGPVLYRYVYTSSDLYTKLPPKVVAYSDRDAAENKGILYYLLYTTQFFGTPVPEGYDKSEFAELEGRDTQMKVKPNILMIMGEAYFDLSKLDIFGYPDGVSPTQQFDRLAKDSLLTGRIIVPSFGGGTADTEFDVLTGCQTIRCAPNKTFAFNSVLYDTGSIARVLKQHGYKTRAFHPGFNFFYKRQTVYPRLGFDEVYFEDSVKNQILVSGYMQEKLTFDEYKGRLHAHVNGANPPAPIFDYMVTIQNHGPYYRGKFGRNFQFECSVSLDDYVRGCLEGYFQGVHEMDVELGKLADMVENDPDPYLIIFYGDHLPSLYGGDQSYDEVGFDIAGDSFESEVRRYSTPYLIWANQSYRKVLESQIANVRNPESQGGSPQDENSQSDSSPGKGNPLPPSLKKENTALISANFLGGLILELIGADGVDDFFSNLNTVRASYPVLSRGYVYDGTTPYLYSEKLSDELKRYYRYEYYQIHERK